jgi:hypothetical protein
MNTQARFMIGAFVVIAVLALSGIFAKEKPRDTLPPPSSAVPVVSIESLSTGGERIKKKNPGWPNATCNAVARKEVIVGMDQWQVVAAWGNVADVTKLTTASGNSESWTMSPRGRRSTVYFKNGIVIAIQQSQ